MSTPAVRTLQRALEALGSKERLASALKVSIAELETYLAQEASVPNQVFLDAIDIVAGKGTSGAGP